MVRAEDHGPGLREVLAADAREPEVEVEDGLQHRARQPVDERVHAFFAGAGVQGGVCGVVGALLPVPAAERVVTVAGHVAPPGLSAGALAGAAAAAVWAAQQPLDQRVFGVRYDDAELLGRWVTRSDVWRPAGVAIHVANGALFGAVYSAVAPSLPVHPALRGPLAGLAEHLATWPGTAVLPRVAPVGRALPAAVGLRPRVRAGHVAPRAVRHRARRARASAEPADDVAAPIDDATVSTNGHGSAEHLVAPGPASPELARPDHRRVRVRGLAPRGACAVAGDDVVAPPAPPASTCSTPPPWRAPWRTRRRTSSTTSPRSRTSAARGRRRGDARARTRRWRSTCSRRSGATRRRRRRRGLLRRGLRAARGAAGRRGRAAAPAEPVRRLQGRGGPARRAVRRRPRAAGRAAARVQPLRAGPAAALRDRLVRAAGRGGTRGGRRADPRA